jgi:sporulation protein YlmC with PRC-barrel domain
LRGPSKIFAGSMAGKEVVDINGGVMGEVEDLVFNIETGQIVDLVVKPDSQLTRSKYREDDKYVLLPFSSVCAVRDYIVVDGSRAEKK